MATGQQQLLLTRWFRDDDAVPQGRASARPCRRRASSCASAVTASRSVLAAARVPQPRARDSRRARAHRRHCRGAQGTDRVRVRLPAVRRPRRRRRALVAPQARREPRVPARGHRAAAQHRADAALDGRPTACSLRGRPHNHPSVEGTGAVISPISTEATCPRTAHPDDARSPCARRYQMRLHRQRLEHHERQPRPSGDWASGPDEDRMRIMPIEPATSRCACIRGRCPGVLALQSLDEAACVRRLRTPLGGSR